MKNTTINTAKTYVIGIDYGTDSVRSLLVDARNGDELAMSVFEYPRWKTGAWCDDREKRFRQHPMDYIEGLEYVIRDLLTQVPGARDYIKAIALDTTGSTPCFTDKKGMPLALSDEHKDNPNAMFILWKDHTAMYEADEINKLCSGWETDYTSFTGKNYSSEWFWAKALHILKTDTKVRRDAYSIVEHCDWMPALLTGVDKAENIKRSRCSAGHKAMWSGSWDGFPTQQFLSRLSPFLDGFASRMDRTTYTCDQPAGYLSPEWAERLGLSGDVIIGIGNTDAHAGAVGAGIKYKTLVQNLGTSTCNMAIMPADIVGDKLIEGISGQVDGSIIPGMTGFEAGMSAFGDVYAWFKKMLVDPAKELILQSESVNDEEKEQLTIEITEKMFTFLTDKAMKIKLEENSLFATDWLNGRRNPYINYNLRGSLCGLSLSTNAAEIFRALVEATAFGVKAIVDHFTTNGVVIEEIIATGGISLKSPFIMQVLSDVLEKPIKVSDAKQSCALGDVMFAATAAGFYPDVEKAQDAIMKKHSKVYLPDKDKSGIYARRYGQYRKLGFFTEEHLLL